ncbi:hypothetical protein HYT45_02945 [Candidatus Uhrbacteria bacterium]|nr:hypothetical protein [Candidatus Uhrbacteria bacterium]
MGQRNRGQGGGGKKKGDGEKVKVRGPSRYSETTRRANKRRNLLTEANRAERKFKKLGRRGDLTGHPERVMRIRSHINRLNKQANI